MNSNADQPNASPVPGSGSTGLSFMDKQYANMSGCGLVAVIVIIPFLAVLFGVVGLIACKDTKARERATAMTIGGAIWFAVCLLLLFATLQSAPRMPSEGAPKGRPTQGSAHTAEQEPAANGQNDTLELLKKQSSPAPSGATGPQEIPTRKWTSGQYSVEARLLTIESGSVCLEKADGKSVTVPIEKLSELDQQFVKSLEQKIVALVEQLSSEDFDTASSAGFQLGEVGPPAIPALTEVLKGEDERVRGLACFALANVGSQGIPILINALEDEDADVRRAASTVLRSVTAGKVRRANQSGVIAAIPALTKALGHEDAGVRANVALALANIGPPGISALIETFNDEAGSEEMRLAAAYVLAERGADAVPVFVEALESEKPETLELALDALVIIGPTAKAAIPALQRLEESGGVMGRRATEVLSLIRQDPRVTKHVDTLKTGNQSERRAAAVALGEIGASAASALPSLYAALDGKGLVLGGGSQDPYVEDVTTAIARVAEGRAVDHAYRLFKQEKGQGALLLVILKVGDDAVPPLCDLITPEQDAKTCKWAMAWLGLIEGRIGKNRHLAVKTLQGVLDHPDREVREDARELLEKIKPKQE